MSSSSSDFSGVDIPDVDITSRLARIEIISFDLDETLWPLEPTISNAENTLGEWMATHAPRVAETFSHDEIAQLRLEFRETHPHLKGDVSKMRGEFLTSLFERVNYPATKARDAFDVYYHARSQVTLYQGVPQLLRQLASHYKLAALTNGNADLHIIGLADLFDDIQCATLDNLAKPHRAMFDRCAENLGHTTAEILHVGDNPETDIGGGKNAGAMTAWFNQHAEPWPQAHMPPDVELRELAHLSAMLPRLNKAV